MVFSSMLCGIVLGFCCCGEGWDSDFLLAESYRHWTAEPKQGTTRNIAMILDKISQHPSRFLHFPRRVAEIGGALLSKLE